MAELADALVLGSSVHDVQVQVLLAAPKEMTEVYPLRGGTYLGHFYFSVVSAGTTPYSSALTGSA